MKTNKTRTIGNIVSRYVGLFLVFGVLLSVASTDVFAQVPPANTQIGNQASATYVDNGGNPQSITSNTVITIVQQVAGVTITPGIGLTVSPGGQVTFPHTITNTGNGVDNFDLSTLEGSGDFNFNSIVIYADEDGNGVPDNFTPITVTPNIDPAGTPNGNTYGIVIVADIPTTALDEDVETIDVTAASNYAQSQSQTVDDTATNTTTVDENAVVNVQKTRNKQFVAVGDTVTFTFNFAESGGSANATNLIIRDPLPAGITYVPNSGRWSGATGTPLTDSETGETATGITYKYVDSGTDSIVVQITNLNAGASGNVSFKATVNAGQEGNQIFNSGNFIHDDLNNFTNTNTVSITVEDNFDIESVGPDTVSAPVANQGDIVNFLNVFQNVGTATDTYNITLSNDNYPAGTTFTFYKVDANNQPTSPYTDTNNDGIPDTGPIQVDSLAKVILQVNLPSGQSGGPYSVVKTLTSINDPNEKDFHVDKLDGITVPTVDITNDAGNTLGLGAGPEPNPVTTLPANPGTTVNFSLYIKNTSLQADVYALAFATDTTGAGGLDVGSTLPSGWTASFRDPNNGNSVVTSTGSIAAGATKQITFRVNIPAGYQPGLIDLYVRALSQNTGAVDIKHEAVNVQTVRQITLVSPQTSQVSPGGTVDYLHTLTVNSNVPENDGTNSDLELDLTNSVPLGWTAVVYWDVDNNGSVNTGDSLLTSASTPGVVSFPATIGTLGFGD